jgi:hypothetical protein
MIHLSYPIGLIESNKRPDALHPFARTDEHGTCESPRLSIQIELGGHAPIPDACTGASAPR